MREKENNMVHHEPVLRSGFVARAPDAAPSALDWRRIPAITSGLVDGFSASARRITTDLTGFVRASRLDGAEAEILAAMQALRELRLAVRQMRADVKAERSAAA